MSKCNASKVCDSLTSDNSIKVHFFSFSCVETSCTRLYALICRLPSWSFGQSVNLSNILLQYSVSSRTFFQGHLREWCNDVIVRFRIMKCATKSILQKNFEKMVLKNQLDNLKKTKHSKVTYFCIVYASTHILTYPILGTTLF